VTLRYEGAVFYRQLFLDGLHYTRFGVARRDVGCHGGHEQTDMMESQRRLYDLDLLSGETPSRHRGQRVRARTCSLRARKRIDTLDYGVGSNSRPGPPSFGTNQPLGQTASVSRFLRVAASIWAVSSDPHHEDLTSAGLQQRGLISYNTQTADRGEPRISPPRRSTTTPWTYPP